MSRTVKRSRESSGTGAGAPRSGAGPHRRPLHDAGLREVAASRLRPYGRVVLAVSGGRDSMVLLDAVAHACRRQVACVAVFDHGTGEAATRAAALVSSRASALGLRSRVERSARAAASEAAWRAARWEFLFRVAREEGGVVVTAHTRDDAVETIVQRVLRGAGARGLAALHADSPVVRPWLEVSRADIARYAAARGLEWVEDPSNLSRRHLRNRVRLDLLPALERARPGLSGEMLAAARRAAALRRSVDDVVRRAVRPRTEDGTLAVAAEALSGYDARALVLLWPALAGMIGIALDRRGTARLIEFTITGRPGSRIQLSGGFEAVRHRGQLLVRRARPAEPEQAARVLRDGAVAGGWRFRLLPDAARAGTAAEVRHLVAALPAAPPAAVRSWLPGDRMTPLGAARSRRVRGLLRDAGVDAASRMTWPVVLVGGEIVWVPGVRRSSAATARPGRPEVWFSCERDDG